MFHDRHWFETAEQRLGARAGHTWFLVQVKPNAAAIAQRNLIRQGFETFAPMRVETRRRAGRFRDEKRLLFPGYVFVALNPETGPWRSINSTMGVSRLVSFGGWPQPVPRGLVEQIALGCDADGVLLPPAELEPGDRVLVSTGPFAGLLAEVERCEADRRVWILLDLMGQQMRVQIDCDAVARK